MRLAILPVIVATFLCGCRDYVGAIGDLNDLLVGKDAEVRRLQRDLDQMKQAETSRQEQIRQLQALGEKRLDKLFHVAAIRLSRFTGGYNTRPTLGHEGVKVYITPIDADGCVIKAAGDITIGLFDLSAGGEGVRIGEFHFDVDQAAKRWFSGALTYHYSFVCPWPKNPPLTNEVTVRVQFIDYLTGKTFTAQKLCPITLPAVERPTAATAATDGPY